MVETIRDQVRSFLPEDCEIVERAEHDAFQTHDEEVLAQFGERLLLKFSSDRGQLFMSIGSQDHPGNFVSVEYIAKMLGWITDKEWLAYQQLEDQFVFTSDENAGPPDPIRSLHEWLELVVKYRYNLEDEFFNERFESNCLKITDMVNAYLDRAPTGSAEEFPTFHLPRQSSVGTGGS